MDRILVVEDEGNMRDIIRDYLTAHGLECDLARDGREALELLEEADFDATAPCPFCFSPLWGARRTCSGATPWGRTTM